MITLSTLDSQSYLISEAASIQWWTICTLPCRTCDSGNLTRCLSCYSDPLLVASQTLFQSNNYTCVGLCSDQEYLNSTDQVCYSCSASACSNCVNNSLTCTSCPALQYLLALTHNCYSLCPMGYFPSTPTMTCSGCTLSLNCFTCSNELNCTSCASPLYYYVGQCVANCSTVSTNTYPNSTSQLCQTCPTSCLVCAYSTAFTNSISCSTCSSSFLFDNYQCVSSCITAGTIPNPLGTACVACDQSCLTCITTTLNCLSCNTTSLYKYFYLNRCLSICTSGFYPDDTLFLCLPCKSPCQTCMNSSRTYCLSCLPEFSFLNNTCQSLCPLQYYP